MVNPQVTIVVVPRERFSYTRESLESIYKYTTVPFKLIYVDGNSPATVQQYLQEQADSKGFELIRTNYYLSPNRARNMGLAKVSTKYVVFLDNDVIVSPNWLEALVRCAEETGAAVIGPLMCHEEPVHEIVHCAGGETHVIVDATGRRRLREKMYKQGHKVADVLPKMERIQTELCEFHCMFVRTKIFERLGMFDEAMLNTKEHLDFCMNVIQVGETVYFEPESIVTYVPGPPLEWTDIHFYMLRWSDAWELASLSRLREKWNVAEDGYFQHKYKILGWRRKNTIIRPIARKLAFGWEDSLLEKGWVFGLAKVEKILNRFLTARHARIMRQQETFVSSSKSELKQTNVLEV
ncbi:MAG: glycosyltransferase [Calothrix sp. C42_A2020_038]|nr:glycosyltransferase [Calothrix sp. C42_A2020_038]